MSRYFHFIVKCVSWTWTISHLFFKSHQEIEPLRVSPICKKRIQILFPTMQDYIEMVKLADDWTERIWRCKINSVISNLFLSGSWADGMTTPNHDVHMFDAWQQAREFLCANFATPIPWHRVCEHVQLLASLFDEFIITGQGASSDILIWNLNYMTFLLFFKETLASQSVRFVEYGLCSPLWLGVHTEKSKKLSLSMQHLRSSLEF